MPRIHYDAAYLHERAINIRRLATGHADAGSLQMCAKLTKIADEFEAKADELEKAEHAAWSCP